MKKIISIIVVIVLAVSVFFGSNVFTTFGYDTDDTAITLKDAITGFDKSSTTIGEYEVDYFKLLDKCQLSAMSYFDALRMNLSSTDVLALSFASNKKVDTGNYGKTFFIGYIVIKDSNVYLCSVCAGDNGFLTTWYTIDNADIVNDFDLNDFEKQNFFDDFQHDYVSNLKMFSVKHGVVIGVISALIILAILILNKQKKNINNQKLL
ncbi:MAG: hypothetical protein IKM66_10265 [Clostridia bacterium]|nr:hypothetical protein [Clostridia bacterium]